MLVLYGLMCSGGDGNVECNNLLGAGWCTEGTGDIWDGENDGAGGMWNVLPRHH